MSGTRIAFGLLVASVLAAQPASASDITKYDMRAEIAADGSAHVLIDLELSLPPGSRSVVVPIVYAEPANLRVRVPEGVRAECAGSSLRLTLPASTTGRAAVSLTFDVDDVFEATAAPAGGRITVAPGVRYLHPVLLNDQNSSIERLRLQWQLPVGLRAHAIREAQPKLRRNEPGPRASLAAVDNHRDVVLQIGQLNPGETAGVAVELVRESRSWFWAIAGVLMSTAYLMGFRDLVSRRENASAPEET